MAFPLVPALIAGLAAAAGWIVARALAAFGLSILTIEFVVPEIEAAVTAHFNGLPPDVYQLIVFAGVDDAIAIILSAIATKFLSRVFIGKI